jgi:hypothetical protein
MESESPHGLELLLETSVVGLNAVVQLFGGSVFDLLFELFGLFQVLNRPRISLVAIRGYFLWLGIAGLFQRFLKERVGRCFILSLGQKEVHGIAFDIYSSV